MKEVRPITDNEIKLLCVLCKHPGLSEKEILNYTEYKWVSTITRKLKRLKEQRILFGPYYFISLGKLSRNPLHRPLCILELNESYETVISYLRLIKSLTWVFPVLSTHKILLNASFLSSNDAETRNLLQLLKDHNILSDYIFRVRRHRSALEYPDFSGDLNPPLTGLLDPCESIDLSLEQYETEWNECDIRILPYLQRGERLIDILRAERKLNRTWTYKQIRYSREKMVKNGLVNKLHIISPFTPNQCIEFQLFLQPDDITLTQRILQNFGRGGRLYKDYTLCEDGGILFCKSHPLFLKDLMYNLDQVDQIKEKEFYQLRSLSGGNNFNQPADLNCFDFEKQILEYPYHVYTERLKEKLEER